MTCTDCVGCEDCEPDGWALKCTCVFCGEVGHDLADCPEIAKEVKKLRRLKNDTTLPSN